MLNVTIKMCEGTFSCEKVICGMCDEESWGPAPGVTASVKTGVLSGSHYPLSPSPGLSGEPWRAWQAASRETLVQLSCCPGWRAGTCASAGGLAFSQGALYRHDC